MSETYIYKLTSTGYSSARYGACEVCGKHASEVFIQSEKRRFIRHTGEAGWTEHGCRGHLFGHRECLEASRANPHHVVFNTDFYPSATESESDQAKTLQGQLTEHGYFAHYAGGESAAGHGFHVSGTGYYLGYLECDECEQLVSMLNWYESTKKQLLMAGYRPSSASWVDEKLKSAYVCSIESHGSAAYGHPMKEACYIYGRAGSSNF